MATPNALRFQLLRDHNTQQSARQIGALFISLFLALGCGPEKKEKPPAYVPYPVQVKGLTSGFIDVAMGGGGRCALHESGDVYCWGAADYIEPGTEGRFTATPVRVDVPPIKALMSGANLVMLTRNGKSVINLGSGRLFEYSAPSTLPFAGVANDTEGDYDTFCLFLIDRSLRCRDNHFDYATPITELQVNLIQVAGLPLFGGGRAGVGLLDDGSTICAGVGQCGLAASRDYELPKEYGAGPTLANAPKAIYISRGCLVAESGLVYCWGENGAGQLGTGSTEWFDGTWRPVLHVTDGVRVVATGGHSCALTRSKQLWCWGANGAGQLGIGYVSKGACPEEPIGYFPTGEPGHYTCDFGIFEPKHVLDNVEDVALNHGNTCVVLTGGRVKCWGRQDHGYLGNGVTETEPVP